MPPTAIKGDAYTEADQELVLPNKWDVATEMFAESDVLKQYMGEEFVRVLRQLSVRNSARSVSGSLILSTSPT